MSDETPRGSRTGPVAARAPYKVAAALLLILLAAGALRLYDLGGESIWLDESVAVMNAHRPVAALLNLSEGERTDLHPPLYYLTLRGWIALAGDSEASVRTPSAVFGVASVALLFFIGLELWGAQAGLAAAFISALSPFFIQQSQEARMYSLMLLLSAASYYFFIRMVRRGETGWTAVGYSAATALLLYTHYYAPFLVAAQAAAVACLWRRLGGAVRRRWLGCMAVVAVACVPWTPTLASHLHRAAGRGFLSVNPSLRPLAVLNTTWASRYFRLALGPFSIKPHLASAVVLNLLALAGLFARAGAEGRGGGGRGETGGGLALSLKGAASTEGVILGLWLVVPVVVPFALAQVGPVPFWPRYMIGSAAAYYLLSARGFAALLSARRRYLAWGLLAALVALNAPGLADYYRAPQKEAWRDVASLVEREGRPGDLVALAPSYLRAPFGYYYRGPLERALLSEADTPDAIARKLGISRAGGPKRIWLINSHRKKAYEAARRLIASEPAGRYEFVRVQVLRYDLRAER